MPDTSPSPQETRNRIPFHVFNGRRKSTAMIGPVRIDDTTRDALVAGHASAAPREYAKSLGVGAMAGGALGAAAGWATTRRWGLGGLLGAGAGAAIGGASRYSNRQDRKAAIKESPMLAIVSKRKGSSEEAIQSVRDNAVRFSSGRRAGSIDPRTYSTMRPRHISGSFGARNKEASYEEADPQDILNEAYSTYGGMSPSQAAEGLWQGDLNLDQAAGEVTENQALADRRMHLMNLYQNRRAAIGDVQTPIEYRKGLLGFGLAGGLAGGAVGALLRPGSIPAIGVGALLGAGIGGGSRAVVGRKPIQPVDPEVLASSQDTANRWTDDSFRSEFQREMRRRMQAAYRERLREMMRGEIDSYREEY